MSKPLPVQEGCPNVVLLHHTPLSVCTQAIRQCWDSFNRSDDGGPKDRNLVYKVGVTNNHSSTLEHLFYNFEIKGVSRALLQELARHRIASLSVKSSRYTLKELKAVYPIDGCNLGTVGRWCVLTGVVEVDRAAGRQLAVVQSLLQQVVPNDIVKYALPEAYKTALSWSINARSLQNFLSLRTNSSALWEIRRLAFAVLAAVPEDHRYLLEDFIAPGRG